MHSKIIVAIVLLLLVTTVHAHTGLTLGHGFAAGLVHPWLGADHVLAMLAVGLWAGQQGGRMLWGVPLAFVAMMMVGALSAGWAGPLPAAEAGILLSLLVFGGLISFNARPPIAVGVAVTAMFALLHGFAHGSEIPASAPVATYLVGMVLSSSVLHIMGIGLSRLFRAHLFGRWLRAGGAAIAASGMVMWLG